MEKGARVPQMTILAHAKPVSVQQYTCLDGEKFVIRFVPDQQQAQILNTMKTQAGGSDTASMTLARPVHIPNLPQHCISDDALCWCVVPLAVPGHLH